MYTNLRQNLDNMKQIGFITVFLCVCMFSKSVEAQENSKKVELNEMQKDKEDTIFRIVEKTPEFPGGDEARMKFLMDNITYPSGEYRMEGMVVIGFVVDIDGSLSNFEILKSVHPRLDEEALRVAKMMPNWKPAQHRGKAVRVQYQMPITFTLYDNDDVPATIPQKTKEKQKRK